MRKHISRKDYATIVYKKYEFKFYSHSQIQQFNQYSTENPCKFLSTTLISSINIRMLIWFLMGFIDSNRLGNVSIDSARLFFFVRLSIYQLFCWIVGFFRRLNINVSIFTNHYDVYWRVLNHDVPVPIGNRAFQQSQSLNRHT